MERVTITSVQKVRSARGEWFYRFGGNLDGERIGDTVEIPVAQADAMGMSQAQQVAKRHLFGLARYLKEQHAAR